MENSLEGRNPEERRLATVMFADVEGFSQLAERLDYETISDLIKEVWIRLDTIIESHGGYVDKHVGDGVMAVWGAPHAGEDDADRAVAAGLALQKTIAKFARESSHSAAEGLRLRIGINTGMVLAGYVGNREEYTVMGDTVNVARRLEQNAEPGTVLIGDGTHHLIRGIYKVRRLEPLQLKGRQQRITAYLVEGFVTQPSKVRYRNSGGLETVMVAREGEFQRLAEYYERSLASPNPTFVVITGEAGIGKSRLLMEFTSQIESQNPEVIVMSARALAQAHRIPFFLWKSLLHNRFGVQDEDPPEQAQEKFLAGVGQLWQHDPASKQILETAHFLGKLTGIDWPDSRYLTEYEGIPDQQVNRSFELTRKLFEHLSKHQPVVLLLDDLQWADGGSLDLITYLLVPGPEPLNLFVLVGTRPGLLSRQPRWANLARVITLKPLPVRAEIVAEAYPGLRHLSHTVHAELAWRSDGNPYFLEEMVKSLVKSGLAEPGYTTQEIIKNIRSNPPESLRGLLQARLDSLYLEAREVLLLASVVGRVFWVGAVLAAARGAQSQGTGFLSPLSTQLEDVVHDALKQLEWAEMVFPRAGTQFSSDQEYIFKHSLLRDVAYSLLPHKYRHQHHRSVAQWLSQKRDPDFRVMVANHLERAGALDEAAQVYEKAAQEAQARGATREALWLLARARSIRGKIKRASAESSGQPP